jgi:uncharacterized small protein (DUF1192 family)
MEKRHSDNLSLCSFEHLQARIRRLEAELERYKRDLETAKRIPQAKGKEVGMRLNNNR